MRPSVARYFSRLVLSAFITLALLGFLSSPAAAQIPQGWQASNMRPIGYSDLDGRGGAFKMAIKQVNGRWYLYMAHLWNRGWSIVDVTDPAKPKVAKFIPGPDNTWTIQMDLHDNLMITALQRMAPQWGGDPNKPNEEGLLIWDINDPLNPKQLSHWKTGSTGVHRAGYPGGRYVNMAANMPGYNGQILVFLDVSDPANPKEAGRWWMPGQKQGEAPAGPGRGGVSFHGPAMVDGNRAILGYGSSFVILDISDIANPKPVSQLNFVPPFKPGISAHSVQPVPSKSIAFISSEGSGGDTAQQAPTCSGPLDLTAIVDYKNPAQPRMISILPVPAPPPNAPFTSFCDKGGRFGPHNTNTLQHLPDVEKQADLIYLAYFNAGLRIFDIKEPRVPRETGWFIPPTPPKRIGLLPAALVNQTEDVLVDTRGNIYITDKQWGLWVLRYSGPDQPAPTAK
jgi:hypothetical protein